MLCPHGLPGEGAPTATPAGPPAPARVPVIASTTVPSRPAPCRPSPDGPRGPYTPPYGPSARVAAPASLLDPGTERDPHPLYRALRGDFPLVHDEPFGAWLISRYADVRAALADPRLAAPGPVAAHGEGGPPGAHRAAVSAALGDRMPASLRAGVERTAHVLASRLAGRQEADLVAEFCQWLPVAAAVTALGLPYEDTARVHAWCRTGLDHLGGHRPGIDAYLRPHLDRRRARPGDDLLSALCAARPGGRPLPDETVTELAVTVLGAAGGTTARALASFLANLLDHPGQLDLIRARPGLAGAAWTESLRRDPPLQIVPRRALEPIGPIPEGATVACLLGAAGRDPARFADPDRYDVFRADPGDLAYGAGPHHCLGAPLARLTAEAGLRALLAVLPGLRRAPGPRPRAEGLVSRSPRTLPVCPR
ncbi:cytochrome P450 [Streptomyces sp. NPDC001914]|uniref:cytochrome P450 n=1 Tax=Streptomyces sp. NPDC001914 TaxID=3364623 RepID=UPI0036A224AE